MLSLIDRWFEPVQASQNYQRQDYLLLCLLLAAGAWLRFWHLGNVGLHGDEDIMGLAARGIVAHGIPILPSDLVYLRAPLHAYLMAGATIIFGDTEWALRLPSAIVGSFCGLLAFFLGKRFLDPKPNLAFVALVTFLPAMIEMSQTARMYVFFVASLLVFGILLFRWERKGSTASFVLASLALLLAVQFHQLAVFAAPMLLYPGLANRSWKQLLLGVIGLGVAVAFSELFGLFAHQSYPNLTERLILETQESYSPIEFLYRGHIGLGIAIAVCVSLAIFAIGTVCIERRRTAGPALMLAVGAGSGVLLHYHIGAIALLFGAISWVRVCPSRFWRLLLIWVIVGLLALAQFQLLQRTGEFQSWEIIGAFVGTPSIWPTLQILSFSSVSAVILISALVTAAYRLAQGHRVPVFFLFFAIAVWAPLFAIGLFTWFPAARYTTGPLPYFLLLSIAGLMNLVERAAPEPRIVRHSTLVRVIGIAIVAAMVNPVGAWRAAKNDYGDHPDHKGAAEFINSLDLGPNDIVIAEDSIIQTYYLGKVNYRLQNLDVARIHSVLRNGVLYGQYTGTPIVGSGRQFQAILNRKPAGNTYIVSSSQVVPDLQDRNRGRGIAEVLASDRLEVVFVGRDQKTTVWKLRRP